MTEPARNEQLIVAPYEGAVADEWDALIRRSVNGTFLHSRRFLSYHASQFQDRSILVRDLKGRLVGVLPVAEDPGNMANVTSHPGITYGGMIHDGSLVGARMVAAFELIADHYRQLGYRRLRYKVVPYAYHRIPAGDDLYALFRLGAQRWRCDLTAIIDLENRSRPRELRQRSLKKAYESGVMVGEDWASVGEYWGVLQEVLLERHGVSPTHTLDEIELLHARFPEQIRLVVAKIGDRVIAGAVLFALGPVLHSQYLATTSRGRELSALDPVVEFSIELACTDGSRYFDFGISNEEDDHRLNESLHRHKVSFGAGSMAHEHYDIHLA